MSTQPNPSNDAREPGDVTPPDDEPAANDTDEQYGVPQRVGSVDPTEEVVEALDSLSSRFILNNPPEDVGDNLNDDREVRACLNAAVEYFHAQLPDHIRQHIKQKWGITDQMISARKIGFVDDSDGVIEYLRSEGFDPLTITRAGLATEVNIKHLFECGGVSSNNAEIIPDHRQDDVVDEDCSHYIDGTIETLVRAQLQGLIQPEEIDLEAVTEYLQANDELYLSNWWDNRITFPYRDTDGEFCYLIVRATDGTDDIIYNNGITDRTSQKCLPVSETRLGAQLSASLDTDDTGDTAHHAGTADIDMETGDLEPGDLDDYVVLPHAAEPFKTPDEDEHEDDVEEAVQTIVEHNDNPGAVSKDELMGIGVMHDPAAAGTLEDRDTARVHLLDVRHDDDYDSPFMLTPPATGVEPGANIEFVNHTAYDAEMKVAGTPEDVWWDGGHLDELDALDCGEPGFYRYEVHVAGEMYNGILICYDEVYTESRNYQVEQWVGDEPGFELDRAKYIKQTIDRAWINNDAIVEPIFGCETVHEGKPLVVTEGVTDAIVAHQYKFPCVAPATTNFKQHHYEEICELAEDVPSVFVVNDNEINNAGINGALRSAKVIQNDGHTVRVGELPRPAGQEKIDVAEFFLQNSRDEFMQVLQDGIRPDEHDLFDPERHDPMFHQQAEQDAVNPGSGTSDGSWDDDFDASNASALYSLTLEEVINFDALDVGSRSGSTIYRGENPIQHHGNSTGYFVIRDHGEFVTAKDYKIESTGDGYYYNALTWLACAAQCTCDPRKQCGCTRTVTRPMGSLAHSEVWWAWHHAKTADHIPFPDDDAVPVKAIWFLAAHHEVIPEKYIPESFDDEQELPAAKYNEVLDLIRNEYELDPGRSKIPTSED